MRSQTLARRAILASFAKYGSPLTAAQIDGERLAASITKNAIDDARGELRRRGILTFSHDGNGHEVGTGKPLWTLAHPERLDHRDQRRLRDLRQTGSAYRPGSRKYRAEQKMRELEATVAALTDALAEGTSVQIAPPASAPKPPRTKTATIRICAGSCALSSMVVRYASHVCYSGSGAEGTWIISYVLSSDEEFKRRSPLRAPIEGK